jgi:aminoglycoside 3-N-acetyltransferase I
LSDYRVVKLGPGEHARARELFSLMAQVFEEPQGELPDAYVAGLLERPDFWAVAALSHEAVVGGITAHTLPLTRSAASELFIYDVAVHAAHQRRGVGRLLLDYLRSAAAEAGIAVAFVAADNEDAHALDFYRAVGGASAPVTIFTFGD